MKGGDIIHRFRAIVKNVVDGDTIDADCYSHFLDLEFKVSSIRFRLLDIDTPEIRGEERNEGVLSKDFLKDLIQGKEVQIESHTKDSFGRYLAYVFLTGEENSEFINVNKLMLKEGYAKPYTE